MHHQQNISTIKPEKNFGSRSTFPAATKLFGYALQLTMKTNSDGSDGQSQHYSL